MSIRKEQVLLILVVLLGAWIASDYLQKPGPTRGLVFSAEEYEATEVDEVALLERLEVPAQRGLHRREVRRPDPALPIRVGLGERRDDAPRRAAHLLRERRAQALLLERDAR